MPRATEARKRIAQSVNDHYHRTNRRLILLRERLTNQMLSRVIPALALHQLKTLDPKQGEAFSFAQSPQLKRLGTQIRQEFGDTLYINLVNGIKHEWQTIDELYNNLNPSEGNVSELSPRRELDQLHSNKAMQAFIKRKDGTHKLGLSERVWNLSDEAVGGLEGAITTALSEGQSSATLARRIRQYLLDPEAQRMAILKTQGKHAQPPNPMYKAMRLARTEINMAYRSAEYERQQALDFVVGIEIKRSGRTYDCDECASLAGKYPKDFKWRGWHPNCRCYTLPILSTDEEFFANNGTPSVNEVRQMPQQFTDYLRRNAERIAQARQRGTLPYFLRDNPKLLERLDGRATPKYSAEEWEQIQKRRDEIFEEAKATLVGKDLFDGIKISTKRVKEFLNQPFIHYPEKNEMLLDISRVLRESTKIISGKGKHQGDLSTHLYETEVNGFKAWLIVVELKENKQIVKYLHSISDRPSIVANVKQK